MDGGSFPDFEAFVVTLGFEAFVAEIFHGFVVDQAIDSTGIGFGVHVVHGATEYHAPFGDD